MATGALLLLALAGLGGLWLAVTRSGGMAPAQRRWFAPAHGLVAVAGLLLAAWATGTGDARAWTGLAVLAGTALGGLAIRWLQRRGRRPAADLVVWLHASGALLGLGLVLIARG